MSNLRPWLARRATLRQIGSLANLVAMGAAIGVVIFLLADAVFAGVFSEPAAPAAAASPSAAAPLSSAPIYRTCAQARAAGAAPLYANEPGYSAHLDRDQDGVACEPYAP